MVKFRLAKICNIKLLLLFLVVLGHWIEDEPGAAPLYRLIYMVHMPGFAFLSGMFIRKESDIIKGLRKLIPCYMIAQTVCRLVIPGTT